MSERALANNPDTDLSDPISPILRFYAWRETPPPPFETVSGESIPEPYRSLLVHQSDMTPTLQNYHRCSLHLRVLFCEVKDGRLTRYVNLLTDDREELVEFGAILIDLSLLELTPRLQVIGGYIPFGGILFNHGIPHNSRPSRFFRVRADKVLQETLAIRRNPVLYGRCNTISLPNGTPLARVVEILPPTFEPANLGSTH